MTVSCPVKEEDGSLDAQIPWNDLKVQPSELRLDQTLMCGQAFRWKPTGESEWTCALWDTVVDLKQTPETVLYRSLGHRTSGYSMKPEHLACELHGYFQLDETLESLCDRWASVDPDFDKLRRTQLGVRALRQPVVENMFTFIASSNNNIKRITMLIDKLCQRYGHPIDTTKGTFYTFPRVQDIAVDKNIEDTFTRLGFGYRAKYYAKTVERLLAEHEDPEQYLFGLRASPSWEHAKAQLMQFNGIGPKVADCICLMSLNKINAVPVDTHIWQIAKRRYVDRVLELGSKSGGVHSSQAIQVADDKRDSIVRLARELSTVKAPTSRTYETAQKLFVELFSPHAGWAQLLLFSGDLDGPKGIKKPSAAGQAKRKASAKPAATASPARVDPVKGKGGMQLRSNRKRNRSNIE
ncbi:8-oxoguanine glycosylase ogg1 [Coemansia sp. RSA 1933]|nr:8-oxoguanine glycosylase ogg1 [Coemansia sp. RSA 1933]